MDSKIQDIGKAQILYDQERKRLELLESSVPKNPAFDTFVRQIEGLAGKSQAQIASMQIGQTVILGQSSPESQKTKKDPLVENAQELTFLINASAPYKELYNFLSDLERLRRPVKIDSLNFRSSETEEGKSLFLVIDARVPFFK